MIWFDVTKAASQKHRSGLMRVSERLRAELAALEGDGLALARWQARRRTWVDDRTGAALDPGPADWLLTPELFSEEERPGLGVWLDHNGARAAAIFHDAIPLRFPEITWPQSVARHPGYMRLLARFGRVLAVSESSARELVDYWRWMGVERTGDVSSLTLGADGHGIARCTTPPDRAASREVVMVGILEPRKNQEAVLDAVEALAREGNRVRLTFVGRVNPHFGGGIEKRIRQMARAGHSVVHRRDLDDRGVADLMAAARFSVQPSRAEGCGLPVLESLWAGLPVVAAGIPSMVESARGGGCLVVEPENLPALAAAMREMLSDDALVSRLTREACTRELPRWRDTAGMIVNRLR